MAARHNAKQENEKQETRKKPVEVDGLNMVNIQSHIQWKGIVYLEMLKEDDETMLSEVEWPKKSGRLFYGCASTGLLFDKQTGRCLQSSRVNLKLETVKPTKCTPSQFSKWVSGRAIKESKHITLKRGPKPKGYVAPDMED